MAPAGGGAPRRLTTSTGDERWPSFTPSGQLVYSLAPAERHLAARHHERRWQGRSGHRSRQAPARRGRDACPQTASGWRTSPTANPNPATRPTSGSLSSAAPDSLACCARHARQAWRVTRPGRLTAREWRTRLTRNGVGGIYVTPSSVDGRDVGADRSRSTARRSRRAAAWTRRRWRGGGATPTDAEILASRKLGVPAWSPDGQTLAIATFVTSNAGYNGNPNRNDNDEPTVLAGANEHALWRVLAPRAVDEAARAGRAHQHRCRALDVGVRSGLADAEGDVLLAGPIGRGVGCAAR